MKVFWWAWPSRRAVLTPWSCLGWDHLSHLLYASSLLHKVICHSLLCQCSPVRTRPVPSKLFALITELRLLGWVWRQWAHDQCCVAWSLWLTSQSAQWMGLQRRMCSASRSGCWCPRRRDGPLAAGPDTTWSTAGILGRAKGERQNQSDRGKYLNMNCTGITKKINTKNVCAKYTLYVHGMLNYLWIFSAERGFVPVQSPRHAQTGCPHTPCHTVRCPGTKLLQNGRDSDGTWSTLVGCILLCLSGERK